jgi:cytochrome b6-f complex iron-sulfur subunit
MTDQEQVDNLLDQVSRGKSPTEGALGLSADERRMVQMAQTLRGTGENDGPGSAFRTRLALRLEQPEPRTMPRRAALLSGLGAVAAGIAAGVGLDRIATAQSTTTRTYGPPTQLVGKNGHWEPVALAADMHEGAVRSFRARAIAGFLVHRDGKIRALSGVCTHMGCLLEYNPAEQGLDCPCHGAKFGLDGWLRSYALVDGYKIPALPELNVRTRQGHIEVWTA